MSVIKTFKPNISIVQNGDIFSLNYNNVLYDAQIDESRIMTLAGHTIQQNTLSILSAASKMCLSAPQDTDPLYCAIEELFKN